MTTGNEQTDPCSKCIKSVHSCYKLLRQLQAAIITPDEYYYNAAIHLLTACHVCIDSYLASLTDAIAVEFDAYLHAMINKEGSMPLVRPFVVNFHDGQEIQLRKQATEPKIERLRQALKARTSGLR